MTDTPYDFIDPDRPKKVQRTIEIKQDRDPIEDRDLKEYPEVRNRTIALTADSNSDKGAEEDTGLFSTITNRVSRYFGWQKN